MAFIPDQLSDGRCIRLFNVIDDFSREALGDRCRLLAAVRARYLQPGPDHFLAQMLWRDSVRQRAKVRRYHA